MWVWEWNTPISSTPVGLGVAVGVQMLLGIDRVELGRGGQVARRVAAADLTGRRIAGQKPARLVGQTGDAVTDHLKVDVVGHPQHAHEIVTVGGRPSRG